MEMHLSKAIESMEKWKPESDDRDQLQGSEPHRKNSSDEQGK